jgi:hypothetical protein
MEEASTPSDNAGSVGADGDLTWGNTPTQSSDNMEGTYSTNFDNGDGDNLSCNSSTTCEEFDTVTADSLTMGCWVNVDAKATQRFILRGASPNHYILTNGPTPDDARCIIGDGTDAVTADSDDDVLETGDGFVHVVCQYDNAANSIQMYIDGAANGSAATQESLSNSSGSDFTISTGSASTDIAGRVDECFIIHDVLTAAEICRICSCGIDGTLCTCNGTAYTDDGRRTTDCGSCDAGDCNAAAP